MGKKAGKKRGRAVTGETEAWSATDHIIRKAKQQRKNATDKQEERERRSALLTRDSKEKHEEGKLRLHIKRVQRQIEKLRGRLEAWDDVEEKRLEKERHEKERRRREEEENPTKKKYVRPGPETWKLTGAARPAWQVYDFDTRYEDPYMKAHEEAKKKVQRSRNIFVLCKGRFGEEGTKEIPQPYCREFLSLLMQFGNLSMQANQLKSARKAFLECMELDSQDDPITPARNQLMRMYMEANRPDSARRLWERLPTTDPSVWIRYSAALIEFVSWKILKEDGSTQESAELRLAHAIRTNVFCAYYLAFFDTFQNIMEYTDDVEDTHGESSLEEAIEYCNSEQMGAWQGTEGACEWVKSIILNVLQGRSIANGVVSLADINSWRDKIDQIKETYAELATNEGDSTNVEEESNDGSDQDDDDQTVVDVNMFAGMFETAMAMLQDAGELNGN